MQADGVCVLNLWLPLVSIMGLFCCCFFFTVFDCIHLFTVFVCIHFLYCIWLLYVVLLYFTIFIHKSETFSPFPHLPVVPIQLLWGVYGGWQLSIKMAEQPRISSGQERGASLNSVWKGLTWDCSFVCVCRRGWVGLLDVCACVCAGAECHGISCLIRHRRVVACLWPKGHALNDMVRDQYLLFACVRAHTHKHTHTQVTQQSLPYHQSSNKINM